MSNRHEQADARLEHLLRQWGADTQASRPVRSPAPRVGGATRLNAWLWRLAPVAAAACLLIGFGIGRVVPGGGPDETPHVVADAQSPSTDLPPIAGARGGGAEAGREIAPHEMDESPIALASAEEDRTDVLDAYLETEADDEAMCRQVDDGLAGLRMQRTIVSRSDQNALQIANRYLHRRLVETQEALAETTGQLDVAHQQMEALDNEVRAMEAMVAQQVAVMESDPTAPEAAILADRDTAQRFEDAGDAYRPMTDLAAGSESGSEGAATASPVPVPGSSPTEPEPAMPLESEEAWTTTNTVTIAGYEQERSLLLEEVEESRREQARLAVSVTQLANRMADPPARSLRECQALLAAQALVPQLAELDAQEEVDPTVASLVDTCQTLLLRLSMMEDRPEEIVAYQAMLDELGVIPDLGTAVRRRDVSPETQATLAQVRLLLTETRSLEVNSRAMAREVPAGD
jgi:hypothetical protein